ncbi:MAG: hypothetical protein L3J39_00745 [Verrucomicrobiales bacterium]|nr:hypothetical protein [Verrucomicrobiales bacterium]
MKTLHATPLFTALSLVAVVLLVSGNTASLHATNSSDLQSAIAAIKNVGLEGKGNEQAGPAWKTLSQADAADLPILLQAMNGASPMASNWLRSVIDTIVARNLKSGSKLSINDIGQFLLNNSNDAKARSLAYDLIASVDPSTAAKLIPGMINDPSPTLRRDAVARLITQASELKSAKKNAAASLIYRQALNNARDADQIKSIAEQLKKLGNQVDLPHHFGFLTHWKVIAPFDNTKREGFAAVFPPEKEIKLDATYPSKDGKDIGWQDLAVSDEYGMLDLNQPFTPLKEVTGYAYTEMNFPSNRPAELRIGCKNAWKIWFNGELIFARDEYHRGMEIDQYQLPIQLKKGKNTLLLKLCQNEQTQSWTVEWQAQVRICDSTGTAILATDRLPTPQAKKATRRKLKK